MADVFQSFHTIFPCVSVGKVLHVACKNDKTTLLAFQKSGGGKYFCT